MNKSRLLTALLVCSTFCVASSQTTYHGNGFYSGATVGSVFSNFNNITSTQSDQLLDSTQTSLVNTAGNQTLKTVSFLAGIDGGYNWQFKQMLVGLGTNILSLSTNSEVYSDSIPFSNSNSLRFVVTSYATNNWLFTLQPRIGVIKSNWLLYATGGLGLALLQTDFLFTLTDGYSHSKQVNTWKPGYVIGAGIEAALTTHINFKAEYLYGYLNTSNAFPMRIPTPVRQKFSDSTSLNFNLISLGLNYQFNTQSTQAPLMSPVLLSASLWEVLLGTRFFVSSGLAGPAQPLLNASNIGDILASRLIYDNLLAFSGETFARVDHTSGLFVQGNLGAGTITQGKFNDEDYPGFIAYSNTFSSVHGNLSYATADAGYSFLKKSFAQTGALIGYNYFAQNLRAYSCIQLGADLDCRIPSNTKKFIGISDNNYFNSLRIGLSTQLNLTNQLSLSSEVAYLPVVNFTGLDSHNNRRFYLTKLIEHGDGAMLELVLTYQLSNSWNLGLGGRYWIWNTDTGIVTSYLSGGSAFRPEPIRANATRYGAFLQLNYHYKKPSTANLSTPHSSWKGLYLGANLGGGWGSSNWSDPFVSTRSDLGGTNVAGFGDKIGLTGPLGGINLNFNWQSNRFVYGASFNINTADIRGENTLFSGLGGINGRMAIAYLGALAGKVGVTFNRSLLYFSGGGALLNNRIILNANTNDLTLGVEKQVTTHWGWTSGAGVEYKFSSHWSTNIEYDYIHLAAHIVSFPSIETINQQRITTNQSLSIFKLGINYLLA